MCARLKQQNVVTKYLEFIYLEQSHGLCVQGHIGIELIGFAYLNIDDVFFIE